MKQSKSDVGGRAEFVGKKPFTERYMPEEFNPVKTKLVDPTGEYVGEVKENPDGSKEFVGKKFNPVKTEIPTHHIETHTPKLNEEQPEPQIKTTAAFDNSRLEFLRMQIGPVQNFYQTLGNILYSLSMRLDVAEAKIEVLKVRLDEEEEDETRTEK